ncbi:MAG: hypothetical protein WAN65_07995 [Candidatus Sulfotelmatobacter sp.]
MYRTTEFETDVRVNGKWVSAGVGAGGETFQVSGEYLAHTLRCGDRVCSLNANRSNTIGWLWKEFEGNSAVLLTGIVFSEAFGGSLRQIHRCLFFVMGAC